MSDEINKWPSDEDMKIKDSLVLNDRLIAEMASRIAPALIKYAKEDSDLNSSEEKNIIASESVALAIAICEEIQGK